MLLAEVLLAEVLLAEVLPLLAVVVVVVMPPVPPLLDAVAMPPLPALGAPPLPVVALVPAPPVPAPLLLLPAPAPPIPELAAWELDEPRCSELEQPVPAPVEPARTTAAARSQGSRRGRGCRIDPERNRIPAPRQTPTTMAS